MMSIVNVGWDIFTITYLMKTKLLGPFQWLTLGLMVEDPKGKNRTYEFYSKRNGLHFDGPFPYVMESLRINRF